MGFTFIHKDLIGRFHQGDMDAGTHRSGRITHTPLAIAVDFLEIGSDNLRDFFCGAASFVILPCPTVLGVKPSSIRISGFLGVNFAPVLPDWKELVVLIVEHLHFCIGAAHIRVQFQGPLTVFCFQVLEGFDFY